MHYFNCNILFQRFLFDAIGFKKIEHLSRKPVSVINPKGGKRGDILWFTKNDRYLINNHVDIAINDWHLTNKTTELPLLNL